MSEKNNHLSKIFNVNGLISKLFYYFDKIPYKFMFIIILLSLRLVEWYPLSIFPMFSKLGGVSDFIYITDEGNRPIALASEFGLGNIYLRKYYRAQVRRLKNNIQNKSNKDRYEKSINAKAGKQLLQFIIDKRKPQTAKPTIYKELKIWQVKISINNKKIIREKQLIAELKLL